MENGETSGKGRLEKPGRGEGTPGIGHLHTVYSDLHINQVYLIYRAERTPVSLPRGRKVRG